MILLPIRSLYGAFFFLILICAFVFRTYNLNWDQNYNLHPDERAIIMFTLALDLPRSIDEFIAPSSPLNPHFFAYGNLPLYLLKIIAHLVYPLSPAITTYGGIHIIGRFISVIADMGTILLIYLIGKKLFNTPVALLGMFLYAFSVFPIQASHFYAVDVLLTFFITLSLFQLVRSYQHTTIRNACLSGIFIGLALATKISALALISAMVITISIDFLLIVAQAPHKPRHWFPHIPKLIKKILHLGILMALCVMITFSITEPYAIISFQEFLEQNLLQSKMTRDAFTFPYTLQYVGILPFWYQIKNILLWGMGPLIAVLSFSGVGYFMFSLVKHRNKKNWAPEIILLTFYLVYFMIVSTFAVGWMRYMLPAYPFLSICGGLLLFRMQQAVSKNVRLFFLFFFVFFSVLWPVSFMHIYTQPNTRVLATEWIHATIPSGKTIAIEHWDDSLPLTGQERYNMITYPLYDPDTQEKWSLMNEKLRKTDYIIIASNRLYAPLQKLTDCQTLPPQFCYPLTAKYYQKLFNGNLGFTKVSELAVYPTIPFLNIPIDDQKADESFTVYDHPKVMIFKKN